jgi:hypothetical protein
MNNGADSLNVPLTSRQIPANFWELFLKDEQLAGCNNLEKLLAGCEVIAALDHIDELLAA